jgi:hypothetical protein
LLSFVSFVSFVFDQRTESSTLRSENIMTIDQWLQAALADADRRGLPGLKPVLEALAKATKALRAADFNDRADAKPPSTINP